MINDYIFKVGDWVRVRQYEDMVDQFGIDRVGGVRCRGGFIPAMRNLCGQEFQITKLDDKIVSGLETQWTISTDMIELVEEDEMFDFSDMAEFLDGFKM